MQATYQARWVSKGRALQLRKSGAASQGALLESFNGYLVVERVGAGLGDGAVLSPQEADAELQAAWCRSPLPKLAEARRLLGLEAPQTSLAGV